MSPVIVQNRFTLKYEPYFCFCSQIEMCFLHDHNSPAVFCYQCITWTTFRVALLACGANEERWNATSVTFFVSYLVLQCATPSSKNDHSRAKSHSLWFCYNHSFKATYACGSRNATLRYDPFLNELLMSLLEHAGVKHHLLYNSTIINIFA